MIKREKLRKNYNEIHDTGQTRGLNFLNDIRPSFIFLSQSISSVRSKHGGEERGRKRQKVCSSTEGPFEVFRM